MKFLLPFSFSKLIKDQGFIENDFNTKNPQKRGKKKEGGEADPLDSNNERGKREAELK